MLFQIVCAVALAAGAEQDVQGKAGTDFAEFSVSRLKCVIGNNLGDGVHRQRYNGIFSMVSPDEPESPFVPAYAGVNLEHYFDSRPRPQDQKLFFEPRNFPIEFRRVSERSAELHQAPTPT